jgi:5-methylcytosine-specific restriction endonuclease McrA
VTRTLLLNASYEPLRIIAFRRAVVLVLEGKADVVEEGDQQLRAATFAMAAPLVIRLRRMVVIPFRARLPLNRTNLVGRDGHRCAYCSRRTDKLTVDHVVPRSRGGRHVWENVVAACGPCNNRKADRLLSELGWSLAFTPKAPKGRILIGYEVLEPEPAWQPYLATAA